MSVVFSTFDTCLLASPCRIFHLVTISTLRAYKTTKRKAYLGCFCFPWRNSKVRLPSGKVVHASADNIATLARLCIQYSKVSYIPLHVSCCCAVQPSLTFDSFL